MTRGSVPFKGKGFSQKEGVVWLPGVPSKGKGFSQKEGVVWLPSVLIICNNNKNQL